MRINFRAAAIACPHCKLMNFVSVVLDAYVNTFPSLENLILLATESSPAVPASLGLSQSNST